MNQYLGHTIINGELRYASVSGVKLFDPRTKGGCPRRWWHRYVRGVREPDSPYVLEAKEAGIALDRELKHYLRTGEKALSPLAIKGLHILEKPGPDIGLDVAINTVEYYRDGAPYIHVVGNPPNEKYPSDVQIVVRSALTAAGVPFVGELDIVHRRGHYRDDDGEFHPDPPGTVEVADLKRKSNEKDKDGNSNFLLPSDLVRDIQMAGYGEWVARVCPDASHVRLSHLYFPAKPAKALPTKVTRLHVLDDCRRTWEYVDTLVRDMKQVARETDIEKVPGNVASCDVYSGCPHRETCSAYRRNSLDGLFNKIADDHVKEQQMGIIANNPGLMQQGTVAPQAAPNMQQQLAAEEQQMRAQVAQQQAQMPMATQQGATAAGADLLTVCYRLSQYGYGFPKLVGAAAQAYAAASGQNVAPGFEFQGVMANAGAQRSLHTLPLSEVAHIYQLESELAAERAKSMPAMPQAPVAQPQQVGVIVQGQAYQTAPIPPAFAPQPVPAPQTGVSAGVGAGHLAQAPMSFLAPGTPESMPQLAAQTAAPQAPAAPPEEKATKKRGRPAKNDTGTAPEAVAPPPSSATQTAAAQAPTPPSTATQVTPAAAPTYRETASMPQCAETEAGWGSVLINARFSSKATKSLAGYVDYVNTELAKRYSVTSDGKPGIQDVRCVPKDSPLAFGGWKGAVREVVKADPPPQGDYHLDTFMDDLNEAVADALRIVAEQRGWIYVRGVR